MYEAFFQFQSRPFPATPVVGNYFPAQSVESARQNLIRAVERAEGPGLIIGPAGVGKTLLRRVLADHFRNTLKTVFLSASRVTTRKSLLQLAQDAGLNITERAYSFDDWKADAASGKLAEAFACGTAAVVAGIGKVKHKGGEFLVGDGQTGPGTLRMRDALVGLQRVQTNDPSGWVHPVALD